MKLSLPTAPQIEASPASDQADAGQRAAEEQVCTRIPIALLGVRVILEQLDRMLEREPGVRRGEDAEEVHKMRVAARRLRTGLRFFRKPLEKTIGTDLLERLRQDLKRISIPLGRVRDLDVFTEALEQRALTAPFGDTAPLERLVADRKYERDVAGAALLATLDGDATQRLRTSTRSTLADRAAGLEREAERNTRKRDLARVWGPDRIVHALCALRRRGKSLQAPTGEELHRTRIAAKRLRYACEFFAPVFPEALDDVTQSATELQDTLGAIHDCDVACETLLLDIARLADDGERAADTAALARLISRYRAEREEATAFVRDEWERLPSAAKVHRRLLK